MDDFSVAFKVISEHNCPFYAADDLFVLTNQAVQVPIGHPSCLILVREVTRLLFTTIVPAVDTGFEELANETYSCGGCTGLIKFQIEEKSKVVVPVGDDLILEDVTGGGSQERRHWQKWKTGWRRYQRPAQ